MIINAKLSVLIRGGFTVDSLELLAIPAGSTIAIMRIDMLHTPNKRALCSLLHSCL